MGFLTKGRKIISDCNLLRMTSEYKSKSLKDKYNEITKELGDEKYSEYNLGDMIGPLDEKHGVISEKISEEIDPSLENVEAAT
jgi:hypothetical protein